MTYGKSALGIVNSESDPKSLTSAYLFWFHEKSTIFWIQEIAIELRRYDLRIEIANCTHFFSIGIPDVPNIATGSPICTKILVYP